MPALPVIQGKGVHSADNQIGESCFGALKEAVNLVSRYRGIYQSRRGQRLTSYSFGSAGNLSNVGAWYGSVLLQHYATTKLCRDTGAAFTDYSGSYTPPDITLLRMKFMEAMGGCYFTTNAGVYGLDVVTATPAKAGVPTALGDTSDAKASLNTGSGTGWQTADTAVSYRYVWGIKDANSNVKLGAPSERLLAKNRLDALIGNVTRAANVVSATVTQTHNFIVGDVVTLLNPNGTFAAGPFTITSVGGTLFTYAEVAANATSTVVHKYSTARNGLLSARIPPGITTSHFVRFYRTEQTQSADTAPSDEHFLMHEGTPTGTDISNGYMPAFTDITPESMLGPPLYTNPETGEGLGEENTRPPLANDICWWDNRAWYLNTTDKHRFNLSLLGVGSPDGIQVNDTITIAGQAFTAKANSAYSLFFFGASSQGRGPATDVEYVARNLVNCINYNAASLTFVAYYISGEADQPGQILIEETGVGGSAITVYASRPASWSPALTTSSTGAQTSVNDRRTNGASYSKREQPEAVPVGNWLPVGVKNRVIYRGIPLSDKLYILTDGGAYAISGPAPYRAELVDATAKIIAPDTAAVHNNQVMFWADQGVVALTDAGARLVSLDIDDLLTAAALTRSAVRAAAFGYSYETEHQYHLWTGAGAAYVFNSLTNQWFPWEASRRWGTVNPSTDVLYMGDGVQRQVRIERKALDRTDYCDEALAVTISSHSGTAVTLASAVGVQVGDMLWQSDGVKSLLTAVNTTTGVCAVRSTESWADTTASVLVAIDCSGKHCPAAPGGPSLTKTFREVSWHFREFYCYDFVTTFDTETDLGEGTAELKPAQGYGLDPYGTAPYGSPLGLRNRKVEVTRNHKQAAMLRVGWTIREAYSLWAINGHTIVHEPGGEGGRP